MTIKAITIPFRETTIAGTLIPMALLSALMKALGPNRDYLFKVVLTFNGEEFPLFITQSTIILILHLSKFKNSIYMMDFLKKQSMP